MENNKRIAIVTGASSGIGKEFFQLLHFLLKGRIAGFGVAQIHIRFPEAGHAVFHAVQDAHHAARKFQPHAGAEPVQLTCTLIPGIDAEEEHEVGTGDMGELQDYDGNPIVITPMEILPYFMWNILGNYSNVYYGANFVDYVGFVEEKLESFDCAMKVQIALAVAIEEVFVNVAHYAYGEGEGDMTLGIGFDAESREITFRMTDKGTPFDPLKKPDPDITLPAEDREIGGLGIFITKKTMDTVTYAYENGENILTMIKKI